MTKLKKCINFLGEYAIALYIGFITTSAVPVDMFWTSWQHWAWLIGGAVCIAWNNHTIRNEQCKGE